MSHFQRFKANCQPDWDAYTQHAFVRQLGDGTLPEACFQHYLKQDYLFLIQFTRAWGLAVFKSHHLDDMRYAQAGINAMLDTEIGLHIEFCQRWGISKDELNQLPEASACVAYTRYVLDCGMQGDLADLHTALAPCVIGYAEIAQWLMAQPFTKLEGNPYREWIEMYASDEYQEAAQLEQTQLERACRDLSDARLSQLSHIFTTATRMEVAFWEMGLNLTP